MQLESHHLALFIGHFKDVTFLAHANLRCMVVCTALSKPLPGVPLRPPHKYMGRTPTAGLCVACRWTRSSAVSTGTAHLAAHTSNGATVHQSFDGQVVVAQVGEPVAIIPEGSREAITQ